MKTTKTLAFNIALRISALITEDANKQQTSESTILRQIIFKHYENDPRLKTETEVKQ